MRNGIWKLWNNWGRQLYVQIHCIQTYINNTANTLTCSEWSIHYGQLLQLIYRLHRDQYATKFTLKTLNINQLYTQHPGSTQYACAFWRFLFTFRNWQHAVCKRWWWICHPPTSSNRWIYPLTLTTSFIPHCNLMRWEASLIKLLTIFRVILTMVQRVFSYSSPVFWNAIKTPHPPDMLVRQRVKQLLQRMSKLERTWLLVRVISGTTVPRPWRGLSQSSRFLKRQKRRK